MGDNEVLELGDAPFTEEQRQLLSKWTLLNSRPSDKPGDTQSTVNPPSEYR